MQARGAPSVFRQVKDGVDGHLWVYEGRVFGIHDDPISLPELAEFCFFIGAEQLVILDRKAPYRHRHPAVLILVIVDG